MERRLDFYRRENVSPFSDFSSDGQKSFFIRISKTWEGSFNFFQLFLLRYFARIVFLNDQDRVKELRQR
ncbi:MAG: hypothetical protein HPY68_10910, partial [Candidatus Atribacteria bacterium]|nr:hypothetical protein [Candidatus Atribacteria bacterium]